METIDIALASDKAYFPGLLVTAASIARSASRDVRLRFNVLNGGIPESDISALRASISSAHPNSGLRTFDIDDARFSGFRAWNGEGRMAYARLLLPDMLPDSQFAVYCDTDFLWTADIADLWKLRDASVPLQACLDETSDTLRREHAWFAEKGIPFDAGRYICSGLLLMNLDMFRRLRLGEALLEFVRSHPDALFPDQAAINAVVRGIGILPAKWGTFARSYTPGEPGGCAVHFAGSAPWRPGWWTQALTDAHEEWYRLYGELAGTSRRAARRKFLSLRQIATRRATWIIARHAALRMPFFLLLRLLRRSCYIPELKEMAP